MKKGFQVMMALVLALGCAIAVSTAGESMPGDDAGALWRYITKTSPYQKWDFWPDHADMYPGKSFHVAFYVGDVREGPELKE